jgi:hypothetical protein
MTRCSPGSGGVSGVEVALRAKCKKKHFGPIAGLTRQTLLDSYRSPNRANGPNRQAPPPRVISNYLGRRNCAFSLMFFGIFDGL